MSAKEKSRALRVLLAALLNSNMSVEELHKVVSDLQNDSLGMELAEALAGIARTLDGQQKPRYLASPSPNKIESSTGRAFATVRRRKLSKQDILAVISTSNIKVSGEGTIKDVLSRFFSLASETQAADFLNRIGGNNVGDPFLKGMSNR